MIPGCLDSSEDSPIGESGGETSLEVWYSFTPDSKEEETFLSAIESFQIENPSVIVDATRVSYGDVDQLYITAAQGGEAPDLVRISSDSMGKFGEIRVDGHPLFEDLRPHLTPEERSRFDERSLESMRYGEHLYSIPASQDCLTLIYNKAMFAGMEEPNENWTIDDLLLAAEELTYGDTHGLEMPSKNAYWWFPFLGGFGGELFDANGNPTLDVNGSADSLDWMFALEQEHGVMSEGTQIEAMKTRFLEYEAAMIIDGPWNWAIYEDGMIDLGQTLLPKVPATGEHLSPLVTYKGWSVSKQSENKVEATDLALWLSSDDVQKEFALETYTMPTSSVVMDDAEIQGNEVISGFLAQAEQGTPAPTGRGMAMVYEALSPAFEQVYTGISDSQTALSAADEHLTSSLAQSEIAAPSMLVEGYRTTTIEFDTDGSSQYTISMDGEPHSVITVGSESIIDSYDGCAYTISEQEKWSCNLTGLEPGVEHHIVVTGQTTLFDNQLTSEVYDELPEPKGTSGVLFAIGSIVLSLIALLSYGAWSDKRAGRVRSRGSHLYIAPAMLALAVLTFYPVLYGFWLSVTDASQTHLGDETFIGLANFWEVFASDGFLRVTLFTIIWTVVNVVAHISIGLFLALLLNDKRLKGRVAYRTVLLLPWAIPSYISVLIWRGIFQPDGLLNDLLGTDLNLLADPTGAQIIVILVNIWLGVPFMMMSLSGALQALPRDMYEAAEVDGVSMFDQFKHLTLPNLKSAMVPLSLLGFIWTFNMFNVIYLMTAGGPNLWFGEPGSTDILITYVYDVAFIDGQYGVAAAWSVVIFLMLVVFSWSYMKRTNATEAVS